MDAPVHDGLEIGHDAFINKFFAQAWVHPIDA